MPHLVSAPALADQPVLELWGDATPAVMIAQQLQAQGLPLWWQAERTGEPVEGIVAGRVGISNRTYVLLERLARQMGERMATPALGLSPAEIDAARLRAMQAGYYPPFAYDDDGHLIPEALPTHPWARDDERCDRRLRAAQMLTDGHTVYEDIAAAIGLSRKSVYRVKVILEVKSKTMGKAWREHLRQQLWLWESSEESAATIAVRLGLIEVSRLRPDNPARLGAPTANDASLVEQVA